MLTPKDIRGLYPMMLIPATEDAADWRTEFSVDLEEAERVAKALVDARCGGIALNETGEGAALLWDEKLQFTQAVLEGSGHQIPVFAGCTAFGTRDTIRQMRAMQAIGADGAIVGLALWQTPTVDNMVRWFADLSEAVPDMPIMVYSDERYFKSDFPPDFWYSVAQEAPTVVACMVTSQSISRNFHDLVERTGDSLVYIPKAPEALDLWRVAPDHVRGLWTTAANLGPEPLVALSDALEASDEARAQAVHEDLASVDPYFPKEKADEFEYYETQAERTRAMHSDFMRPGPLRPPYTDLPPEWAAACKASGEAWAQMRKKYIRSSV